MLDACALLAPSSIPPLAAVDFYFSVDILIKVAFFIVLALSLNLINGFSGMFSLGHHGFFACGAFTATAFLYHAYPTLPSGAFVKAAEITFEIRLLLFLGALGTGTLSAMICGFIIGVPCLRLRGDYLAIATLAFGEMIFIIAQNVVTTTLGMAALTVPDTVVYWNSPQTKEVFHVFFLIGSWVLVMAVAATIYLLIRSSHGRAILAIREDEVPAELVGVNVTGYKMLVFILGAGMAGMAGAMMTAYNRSIDPNEFRFFLCVQLLLMVVLGGQGSITGAALGAALLYLAQVVLKAEPGVQDWWLTLFAVMLVVLMLNRPQGLMGRREAWSLLAEWWGRKSPVLAAPRANSPPSLASLGNSATQQPSGDSAPRGDGDKGGDGDALLKLQGVDKSFGGLKAVSQFALTLRRGELVGLIGPNGAGKTTVFNLITGVYRPTAGEIYLCDKPIQGRKPYEIVLRGVARTFQNIRLFRDLTVLENVRIAFNALTAPRYWHVLSLAARDSIGWLINPRRRYSIWRQDVRVLDERIAEIACMEGFQDLRYGLVASFLRTKKFRAAEKKITADAMELLSILNLAHRADDLAGSLPYGEQRRLEIARALATRPKLLILDEPAAGMNAQETEDLMDLIQWLRPKFNLTILLIEHDMKLVMGICERLVVLDHGEIIATGLPREVKSNPDVIRAYLGTDSVGK